MPTTLDPQQAAEALKRGQVVAFPTETVYGLGACIDQPDAVAAVYALKSRPAGHPLIVHVGGKDWIDQYVHGDLLAIRGLIEAFWPGPLTVVAQKTALVPRAVTGNQSTVALRMPRHPLALAMLEAVGCAVAAPSANRFGKISPTSAQHVFDEFGDDLPCILDGGPCEVGLESTIIDIHEGAPRILRAGAITSEMIADVMPGPLDQDPGSSPRVPGNLPRHYAPERPLYTAEKHDLNAAVQAATTRGARIVVIASDVPESPLRNHDVFLQAPRHIEDYARELYALLRKADAHDDAIIVTELPPNEGLGIAIRDRLARGAHD